MIWDKIIDIKLQQIRRLKNMSNPGKDVFNNYLENLSTNECVELVMVYLDDKPAEHTLITEDPKFQAWLYDRWAEYERWAEVEND